jgi:hypothetical protein
MTSAALDVVDNDADSIYATGHHQSEKQPIACIVVLGWDGKRPE